MPVITYIGVGSNLDQPLKQVTQAQEAIADIPNITLLRRSPWYSSIALSPKQANYVNGIFELSTSLPAHDLLQILFVIENTQGRTRDAHWGSRTLDLDLLLYGDEIINSKTLTVPHPHLSERSFVLMPLLRLNSQLTLPKGSKISSLLASLNTDNAWLMEDEGDVVTFAANKSKLTNN